MAIELEVLVDGRSANSTVDRLRAKLRDLDNHKGINLKANTADAQKKVDILNRSTSDIKTNLKGNKAEVATATATAGVQRLNREIEKTKASLSRPANFTAAGLENTASQIQNYSKTVSEFSSASSKASTASSSLTTNLVRITVASGTLTSVALLSDILTNIDTKINLVSNSTAKFANAFKDVRDIATSTRTPLTDIATLYTKIAVASDTLGTSQREVARVTETISKSLAVSGTTMQEARSAILQLGQGLASGVLAGEELRSVLENAPALARAIAEGMGKTIGDLRKMGEEGQLTAEEVFKAILSQTNVMDDKFKKVGVTFAQAFQNMQTAGLLFFRSISGLFFNSTGGPAEQINKMALAITDFSTRVEQYSTRFQIAVLDTFRDILQFIDAFPDNAKRSFTILRSEIDSIFNFSAYLNAFNIKDYLPSLATLKQWAAGAVAVLLTIVAVVGKVFEGVFSKLGEGMSRVTSSIMNVVRAIKNYVSDVKTRKPASDTNIVKSTGRIYSDSVMTDRRGFMMLNANTGMRNASYNTQGSNLRNVAVNSTAIEKSSFESFVDAVKDSFNTIIDVLKKIKSFFMESFGKLLDNFYSTSIGRYVKIFIEDFKKWFDNSDSQIVHTLKQVLGMRDKVKFAYPMLGKNEMSDDEANVARGPKRTRENRAPGHDLFNAMPTDWQIPVFATLSTIIGLALHSLAKGLVPIFGEKLPMFTFGVYTTILLLYMEKVLDKRLFADATKRVAGGIREFTDMIVKGFLGKGIFGSSGFLGTLTIIGKLALLFEKGRELAMNALKSVTMAPTNLAQYSTDRISQRVLRNRLVDADQRLQFARANPATAPAELARLVTARQNVNTELKTLTKAIDAAGESFKKSAIGLGGGIGGTMGTFAGYQIGAEIVKGMGESSEWAKYGTIIATALTGQAIGAFIGAASVQLGILFYSSISTAIMTAGTFLAGILLTPFGIFAVAIGALILAISNWDRLKEVFNAVKKTVFDPFVDKMTELWNKASKNMQDLIDKLTEKPRGIIRDTLKTDTVIPGTSGTVGDLGSFVGAGIAATWLALKLTATNIGGNMQATMATIQNTVMPILRNFGPFFGGLITALMTEMRQALGVTSPIIRTAIAAIGVGIAAIAGLLTAPAVIAAAVIAAKVAVAAAIGYLIYKTLKYASGTDLPKQKEPSMADQIPAHASGGHIRGPGTGKSDSILARLSNGEFVVNASATAKNRGLLEQINSGSMPAFADGGIAGYASEYMARAETQPTREGAIARDIREGKVPTGVEVFRGIMLPRLNEFFGYKTAVSPLRTMSSAAIFSLINKQSEISEAVNGKRSLSEYLKGNFPGVFDAIPQEQLDSAQPSVEDFIATAGGGALVTALAANAIKRISPPAAMAMTIATSDVLLDAMLGASRGRRDKEPTSLADKALFGLENTPMVGMLGMLSHAMWSPLNKQIKKLYVGSAAAQKEQLGLELDRDSYKRLGLPGFQKGGLPDYDKLFQEQFSKTTRAGLVKGTIPGDDFAGHYNLNDTIAFPKFGNKDSKLEAEAKYLVAQHEFGHHELLNAKLDAGMSNYVMDINSGRISGSRIDEEYLASMYSLANAPFPVSADAQKLLALNLRAYISNLTKETASESKYFNNAWDFADDGVFNASKKDFSIDSMQPSDALVALLSKPGSMSLKFAKQMLGMGNRYSDFVAPGPEYNLDPAIYGPQIHFESHPRYKAPKFRRQTKFSKPLLEYILRSGEDEKPEGFAEGGFADARDLHLRNIGMYAGTKQLRDIGAIGELIRIDAEELFKDSRKINDAITLFDYVINNANEKDSTTKIYASNAKKAILRGDKELFKALSVDFTADFQDALDKMMPKYASGGNIRGPGTGTSDSIPAMLSDGEFVVNAKATTKHRSLLEAINNGAGLRYFSQGGYNDEQLTNIGYAKAAAAKYKLDEAIFLAMIKTESNFMTGAKSPKGAQGPGQFMPSTWTREMKQPIEKITDAALNLDMSAKYLRMHLDNPKSGGKYESAIARYHSGQFNTNFEGSDGGITTKDHVYKVMATARASNSNQGDIRRVDNLSGSDRSIGEKLRDGIVAILDKLGLSGASAKVSEIVNNLLGKRVEEIENEISAQIREVSHNDEGFQQISDIFKEHGFEITAEKLKALQENELQELADTVNKFNKMNEVYTNYRVAELGYQKDATDTNRQIFLLARKRLKEAGDINAVERFIIGAPDRMRQLTDKTATNVPGLSGEKVGEFQQKLDNGADFAFAVKRALSGRVDAEFFKTLTEFDDNASKKLNDWSKEALIRNLDSLIEGEKELELAGTDKLQRATAERKIRTAAAGTKNLIAEAVGASLEEGKWGSFIKGPARNLGISFGTEFTNTLSAAVSEAFKGNRNWIHGPESVLRKMANDVANKIIDVSVDSFLKAFMKNTFDGFIKSMMASQAQAFTNIGDWLGGAVKKAFSSKGATKIEDMSADDQLVSVASISKHTEELSKNLKEDAIKREIDMSANTDSVAEVFKVANREQIEVNEGLSTSLVKNVKALDGNLTTNSETLGTTLSGNNLTLSGLLQNGWNVLRGILESSWKTLGDVLRNAWSVLTSIFSGSSTSGVGDGSGGLVGGIFKSVTNLFSGGPGFDFGASLSGSLELGTSVIVGGSNAFSYMSGGGQVWGQGTGTSDSIPAMLSNGEYVIKADSAKKYRNILDGINSGNISRFADGGLVTEGALTPDIAAMSASSDALQKDAASKVTRSGSTQVFNINITGDVSRQTRAEIQRMIPQIATGVNMTNREQGNRK